MKTRVIALMVGALILSAAPASADHTFVATATATGLRIGLAEEGQNLTIGFTEAGVQSGPTEDGLCEANEIACARAAAALEPFGDSARAAAPGNEGPHAAEGFDIPAELEQILSGGAGVGTAQAAGEPNPRGQGDAAAGRLSINLTQTLLNEIPELQEGLQTISDALLGPIAEGDPTGELGPRLKGIVDQVISGDVPLATIDLGPSQSFAEDVDGVATAQGRAQGVTIVIAPLPESTAANPQGMIIIESGAARARVSSDQSTATAEAHPAIVSARFFNPATQDYEVVEIPPEGAGDCGGEAPLVVCVGAADKEERVDGAGAVARAHAVQIRLFDDPAPQLVIELAGAEAAVNAAPAEAPAPTPEAVPDLPRTGFGGLALPALFLLGVGTLGWATLRRRGV